MTLDGVEADKMLATHRYDCVALDIMLPGKDGYTILQEMRQKGNTHAGALCDRQGLARRPRHGTELRR
jgi:DNA-binding response OmpR family regulator